MGCFNPVLNGRGQVRRLKKPMKRIGLWLSLAGMFVLVLTACARGESVTETPSQEPGAQDAVGDNLPLNFTYFPYADEMSTKEEGVPFSDLFASGKPVVLNMWAGLCPPCRAEMPDFQEEYLQSGNEYVLFGLDIGPFVGLGDRDDAMALLNEFDITFPTGNTNQRDVVSAYGLMGMPSTFFIKPDGTVFNKWSGPLNGEKLRELANELIEAS